MCFYLVSCLVYFSKNPTKKEIEIIFTAILMLILVVVFVLRFYLIHLGKKNFRKDEIESVVKDLN